MLLLKIPTEALYELHVSDKMTWSRDSTTMHLGKMIKQVGFCMKSSQTIHNAIRAISHQLLLSWKAMLSLDSFCSFVVSSSMDT